MPFRSELLAADEYYHVYGRGVRKAVIIEDEADALRFIFLLLFFQFKQQFSNIGHYVKAFEKSGMINSASLSDGNPLQQLLRKLGSQRLVEVICFTAMPNHFHLLLRALIDEGISQYMQRVLNAYAKYFNAKHSLSGHLFQGPYGLVLQEDNDQILHTSAYIHHNQKEVKGWRGKEEHYTWSSYWDYTKGNRWGDLLKTDIISDQFSSPDDYKKFVIESEIKEDKFDEEDN